jgi:hypothetical protein
MAFWVDCWTSVLCAVWVIAAWPATTAPPAGLADAGWTRASADTRQLVAIKVDFKRF